MKKISNRSSSNLISPSPSLGGVTTSVASGNMSGIAALAAAAAATSKISTMPPTSTVTAVAGVGQQQPQQHHAIKVVQQPGGGQQLVTSQGVKVTPMQQGQAMIGGQTVRLASPGGTLLKTGTTITSQVVRKINVRILTDVNFNVDFFLQGGKQIILQKQGPGGSQPQIVTLVKTSTGMQVATVPKASIVQGGKPAVMAAGGQQIIQTQGGKTIPQGATIVKLVNAQGGAGQTAKIVTNVKTLGSNVMTMAKPGTVQMGAGGKQTIVINKPGGGAMGTALKGAHGQQIIVVSTGAGGIKTMQTINTAQATSMSGTMTSNVLGGAITTTGQTMGIAQPGTPGSGVKMIVVSSGQLAQTTGGNKPITIAVPGHAGGQAKTVTLAGKPGQQTQLLNTSTGQILALPAGNILSTGIGGTQVGLPS